MERYNNKFKNYSVEQKRRDLLINPLFNPEAIKDAPDKGIIQLHEQYFVAMNRTMENRLGESLFDDEW